MRNTIRLPADVELALDFINSSDGREITGTARYTIESVPNGKFQRVTKVTVHVGGQDIITIVPKERKPL